MIVIGDVHGEYDQLQKLVEKLPHQDNLVFLGDLIDRGPEPKKVVDFVIENNYSCTMGNHEEFLLESLRVNEEGERSFDQTVLKMWKQNGGTTTLQSFGEEIWEYLPWFHSLPLYIQYGRYVLSHSYMIHGWQTHPDDILWGRNFSQQIPDMFINVFGHTIHKQPAQYHSRHWCIDTGAYQLGILTAMDLDTRKFYFSRNI